MLADYAKVRSQAWGTGTLDPARPIIATGHQCFLWHPGILAKDLAMHAVAQRSGAGMIHLLVDQDAHDALKLDLPIRAGDALGVETISLGPESPIVATGSQPPTDEARALATLIAAQRKFAGSLQGNLDSLIGAWGNQIGDVPTLALQLGLVLHHLMQPIVGKLALLQATDLLTLPSVTPMLELMLDEAPRCIARYNEAAAAFPEARVAPLTVTRDLIELPLWVLPWRAERQRVFADLTDSKPAFVLEDGSPVDARAMIDAALSRLHRRVREPVTTPLLAPRALLLTAIMRSVACDLFIHGKGGGVYEQVTEQWWRTWTGTALPAPATVASADVFLPMDVPTADENDVRRAVWWAHHLPHNVDRAVPVNDWTLARWKHDLLEQLRTPYDRADRIERHRRRDLFKQLHRVNDALVAAYPTVIEQSRANLTRARTGLANRAIARRRDWCFALHSSPSLGRLRAAIHGEKSACA